MAVLNNGDRGAGVILLQGILHRLEYDITNIDGIFGEETEEAVRAFQEDMELDIDGKVGEDTAQTLVGELWALGFEDDEEWDDEDEDWDAEDDDLV